MKTPELTFVIPTYGLRDVAQAVDAYDESLGHHEIAHGRQLKPAEERIVIFNEEVANLLKRKIRSTITRTDDLGFAFDVNLPGCADDAR
jgi:hypothetical protein